MSSTECLNLTVSLPESLTMTTRTSTVPAPVFVLVHGGGFALGANSWPQWDLARVVRRSVVGGRGVIAVGINYRLGAPGFLTSQDLRAAGYKPNNGLRDQAAALQWVQRHISGFGGDPANVTFLGQSAGGVSGHHHLASPTPLFKRLALLGGTTLLMPPLPPPAAEASYAATLQTLGLSDLSPSARVKALVETPIEDLVAKLGPQIPFMPVLDGEGGVVPAAATFEQVAVGGREWCRELFIGDCEDDGLIFDFMLGPRATSPALAASFVDSATATLASLKHSPAATSRFLAAYGIDPSLDPTTAIPRILQFVSEICFHAPTVALARHWATKCDGWNAYVWRFNEPNPWPGKWQGRVTHILDLAYLCMNYEEVLTEAQREVGRAFADDFIKFVNEVGPWESVRSGPHETARVYGPSDAGVAATDVSQMVGERVGRKDTVYRLADGEDGIPLDHLAAVWGNFLMGV